MVWALWVPFSKGVGEGSDSYFIQLVHDNRPAVKRAGCVH